MPESNGVRQNRRWFLGVAVVVVAAMVGVLPEGVRGRERDILTNNWLVELNHDGGERVARSVAEQTGFTFVSPVMGSDSEFHFLHRGVAHARVRRSIPHTRILRAHPHVKSAVQMTGFIRRKRGFKPIPKTVVKSPASFASRGQNAHAQDRLPTDPDFPKEWFLHNTGQSKGVPGLDLNVVEAWSMGYTGKGVTTAIMDDGIDYLHEDLKYNYNAEASYDFSSNDPYPYPRYTDTWFNSHGTRCAGEVSAARDNNVCGVGVAYGSMVARW
ncbi:hypothetical protein ACOMHN_020814 [Nucella lapillus]